MVQLDGPNSLDLETTQTMTCHTNTGLGILYGFGAERHTLNQLRKLGFYRYYEANDFESKHPRGEAGRFSSKGSVASGIPAFDTYTDAQAWITAKSREYGDRNKFLSSDEYKTAYPAIQEAYRAERKGHQQRAAKAMQDAGIKAGDRVMYDHVSSFGTVESYSGVVSMRNGIPHVKLDEGQVTIDNKHSTRWHKGWQKES